MYEVRPGAVREGIIYSTRVPSRQKRHEEPRKASGDGLTVHKVRVGQLRDEEGINTQRTQPGDELLGIQRGLDNSGLRRAIST